MDSVLPSFIPFTERDILCFLSGYFKSIFFCSEDLTASVNMKQCLDESNVTICQTDFFAIIGSNLGSYIKNPNL